MSVYLHTAITGAPRANTTCQLYGGGRATFHVGDYVEVIDRPGTRPTELAMVARDDTPPSGDSLAVEIAIEDHRHVFGQVTEGPFKRVLTWVMVERTVPPRRGWIRRMGIGVERRQHGNTVVADVEFDDRLFAQISSHRSVFGPLTRGHGEGNVESYAARLLIPMSDRNEPVMVEVYEPAADERERLDDLRSRLGMGGRR